MMGQYSHTGPDHVELLKWNINLFKEMVHSLENGDWTVEDGYRGKEPLHYKLLLEGVINKMEEFNQQLELRTNQLTAQVQQLSEHVHLLKDDVEDIKEKLDRLQLKDLIQKMNVIIEQQDDREQEQVQQSENDRLKSEIDQLKAEMKAQRTQEYAEQETPAKGQAGPKVSEYRRLKTMLHSSPMYPAQRQDYYPPQQPYPYSSPASYYPPQPGQYQQNYPVSHESTRRGQKRSSRHPFIEPVKNTILKSTSKKNDKEPAQTVSSYTPPAVTTIQKEPENKKALVQTIAHTIASIPAEESVLPEQQTSKGMKRTSPVSIEKAKITQKQKPEIVYPESETLVEKETPAKKREFSSIFSIFQKWNG